MTQKNVRTLKISIHRSNSKDLNPSCRVRTKQQVILTRKKVVNKTNDQTETEADLEKKSRFEYVSDSPSNDSNWKKTNIDTRDQAQNWHRKKCKYRLPCSQCCIIVSIFGVILLLIGLATAFVVLFSAHDVTTISSSEKQTSSTSSTTSATTSTLTTDTTTTTCSSVFASTSGLVAYFPMDSSPSYLTDVGGTPTATAVSVANVPGERNQALSFQGTINSYFQSSSFLSLGTPNAPFTIAAYISPSNLTGTIVHISIYQNGTSNWCLPFIGFSSTSQIAIQIWGGSTASYVLGPIIPLDSWTHVVQTYSSTNGLCLYINGTLYAQNYAATTYAASGAANYLTLASTLKAIPYPLNGCSTTGVLAGMGYYSGLIDELRVYNRELSFLEVCALAKY